MARKNKNIYKDSYFKKVVFLIIFSKHICLQIAPTYCTDSLARNTCINVLSVATHYFVNTYLFLVLTSTIVIFAALAIGGLKFDAVFLAVPK